MFSFLLRCFNNFIIVTSGIARTENTHTRARTLQQRVIGKQQLITWREQRAHRRWRAQCRTHALPGYSTGESVAFKAQNDASFFSHSAADDTEWVRAARAEDVVPGASVSPRGTTQWVGCTGQHFGMFSPVNNNNNTHQRQEIRRK